MSITVIVTTSPVQSNPSIDMIKRTLSSVKSIMNCKILIICDGYTTHNKSAFKSGRVTNEVAENYKQYIINLKKYLADDENYQIIERDQRCGFAENVKFCLNLITTEFVMVVQHDYMFSRSFDFEGVIAKMKEHEEIKYVGLVASSNKHLLNDIISKQEYNKLYTDIYKLATGSKDDENIPRLCDFDKKNLVMNYFTEKYKMPLLPMPFWYDKNHIAKVSHYKEFVFGKYSYLVKNFIEDTLGQAELHEVTTYGMETINKFGTYLLFDDDKNMCLMHLHGRAFLTDEQRLLKIEQNKQDNDI